MSASAASLNQLIQNTDRSINAGLLPALTETARALGTNVERVSAALREVADKSAVTMDDLNAILGSPEWKEALATLNDTMRHVDGTAANIEKATAEMPAIAGSMEKIARTSSKFQKALILVNVLSVVMRTFF